MIPLIQGDLFAVQTGGLVGRLIRLRDRLRSSDGEAEFSHCGIITDPNGDTFESRRVIDEYNIYDLYAGKRVLIARPVCQQFFKDAAIRKLIAKYKRIKYPWWRIALHAISPTIARYLHYSGIPVCSELDAEYLHLIGVRHENYFGTTPDMLVDEWRHWREFEIIHDGILPAREPQ